MPHFCRRPWAARPAASSGKEVVRLREWARGDRRPATATNSCPASRTGPGGRSPSPRWNASARRSARSRPSASANWPRHNAADADVVVTNHAMLAVSAFEGLAVLPGLRRRGGGRGPRAAGPGDRRGVGPAVRGHGPRRRLRRPQAHRDHRGGAQHAAARLEVALEAFPAGCCPTACDEEQLGPAWTSCGTRAARRCPIPRAKRSSGGGRRQAARPLPALAGASGALRTAAGRARKPAKSFGSPATARSTRAGDYAAGRDATGDCSTSPR